MSTAKTTQPKLLIVFDSNIIFTDSPSDLVKLEIKQMIALNTEHQDLSINWYIPSVVLLEREAQMRKAAAKSLGAIGKIEALLGHRLNITEDIIASLIPQKIQKEMLLIGCERLELDTDSVDWPSLISDAAFRRPPFGASEEKEKGFRDALILQSVVQLAKASPKTSQICRILVVTEDADLLKALELLSVEFSNLKAYHNPEDLQEYINTLASRVTEDFVNKVKVPAERVFFSKDDPDCLFEREHIRSVIQQKYGSNIAQKPVYASKRINGDWVIRQPEFKIKKKQRITWVTRILIPATLYATAVASNSPSSNGIQIGDQSTWVTLGTSPARVSQNNPFFIDPSASSQTPSSFNQVFGGTPLGLSPSSGRRDIWTGSGETILEVEWSATINSITQKFTKATIDEVRYIETLWHSL